MLAVLDRVHGSSSKDSVREEKSQGSSQGIEAGQTFVEALQSPREVEELVGPKLLSSQEINLFSVVSSFEWGFNGKVERSVWDCFKMESGFALPLPVSVAARYDGANPVRLVVLGRRKKMKNVELLRLGLGLGKMGMGFSGLGSGLVGPGLGSGSGSSGLVLGSVSRLNVISRRIPVSLMVADAQIRPEEASLTVFGSLTVFDELSCRPEVTGSSSTVSSSSMEFNVQSIRSEVTGSVSMVSGSLSVSSTSSVCTDESWVS